MAKNQSLKIGKLPDKTPVKLGITVTPDLKRDLERYTQVYEAAYGESASVAELVPSMLSAFLASDSGFKKALKAPAT